MKKILYIGNRLNSAKFTVTSVETLGNLLRSEGYTVYTASSKINKWVRFTDMCLAVIKYRHKVDVVLIDTYSTLNFYYAVAVGYLCRFFKIPYIPILHGGNLPQRIKNSQRLSNTLFKNAHNNVAPSEYMYQLFLDCGYSNVVLIPNTVEIKNYPYRNQSHFSPKLLWVRSFAKIYNPVMALKVVEILQKDYPDVQLCMVGPDKDGSLKECKEYAISKNLPVTFTGKLFKEQWIELSENYSIFLNTTNFDNTPVSVIEAMALGLPVVTTRVGGIPYIFSEKEAVLVPPDTADAMVSAVADLITNPSKTAEMAADARKKVETFDWNVVKLKWNELLL